MKKILPNIIFFLLFCGFFVGLYFLSGNHYYYNPRQVVDSVIKIVGFLILWFILFVVLHELGHLIWGKLSGMKLLSFRLFFFKIYYYEGSFHFGLSALEGKMGETIFYDKREYNKKRKYSYLLSGGLISLVLTIPLFVLYCLGKEYDYFYNCVFITGTIVGFINSLFSLFPLIDGTANDAGLFHIMLHHETSRKAYYLEMQYKKEIADNKPIKEIELEYNPNNYDDEIEIRVALLSYYSHLAKHDVKAKEIINDLYAKANPSALLKNVIASEYVFYYLYVEENTDLANKAYNIIDNRFKKILKKSYNPALARINYAIAKKITNSVGSHLEEETVNIIQNNHYENQVEFNLSLLQLHKSE